MKLQEVIKNMIRTGAIVVQHTSPDPDAEEKRVLAIPEAPNTAKQRHR